MFMNLESLIVVMMNHFKKGFGAAASWQGEYTQKMLWTSTFITDCFVLY